jgi:GntR family transcriptional repressor for pyruvate dehydrogenase complex
MTELNGSSRIHLARASQVVAAELRSMILFGDFDHGGRMPSEAEFAEKLGISRHHLREALRLLEQDGLVEIKRGHAGGIFLTMPSADVLARSFEGILARQGATLADFMAARAVVEPAAAEMAADKATGEDLAELREICARRERAVEGIPENNAAFHLGVARAAHNRTMFLIIRSLATLVYSVDTTSALPEMHREAEVAHQAILRALTERDAAKARARMRRHITGFEQRLRESGIDPDTTTIVDTLRLAHQTVRLRPTAPAWDTGISAS